MFQTNNIPQREIPFSSFTKIKHKTNKIIEYISITQTPFRFSVVQNTHTKKLYLMKELNKAHRIHLKKFNSEIKLYQKFSHCNLCHLRAYNEDKDHISIIIDYPSKGLLSKLIEENQCFNENNSFIYFNQALNVIDYLHCNNCVLTNLNIDNIFIQEDNTLILYDFNIQTIDHQNRIRFYDLEEDIWFLGVLLLVLTQGILITDSTSTFNLNYNSNDNNNKLSFECNELIKQCLNNSILNNKEISIKVNDIRNSKWVRMRQIDMASSIQKNNEKMDSRHHKTKSAVICKESKFSNGIVSSYRNLFNENGNDIQSSVCDLDLPKERISVCANYFIQLEKKYYDKKNIQMLEMILDDKEDNE